MSLAADTAADRPADDRREPFVRYTQGAIAFHWVIAALVILNILLALGSEWFEWRVIPAHKAIGITVLVLTLGRILWRATHRPPPLPRSVRPWERMAGHATHLGLYALTLALPLTGWWFSSSAPERRPLEWFGLFDIPYLPVPRSGPVTGAVHDWHIYLSWLAIALVLLHAAAALRHHWLLHDATLARILPAARPPA